MLQRSQKSILNVLVLLILTTFLTSCAGVKTLEIFKKEVPRENLNLDKQLLDKINKFAPIKHILKNKLDNHDQIIELLDDISKDLFNYDLEFRIQELESRFSKDMSETTFNELKELKNERKIN